MSVVEDPADVAPVSPPGKSREPRVWKFFGTSVWGLVLFVAMFAGQIAGVAYFIVVNGEPFDLNSLMTLAANGRVISLSVIMGLPAILLVLWIATRWSGIPFADYLALRWPSWRMFGAGIGGLVFLLLAWGGMRRLGGE